MTDPLQPSPALASLDATRRFVPLFAAHQKRIYGLIRALVVSPADADDLLQETSIVLWEKFGEFDSGAPDANFAAWAFRIARYVVQNHHRKQGIRTRAFAPGVFDAIAAEVAAWDDRADARTEALRECLDKLTDRERELVRMRYADAIDTRQIATHVGRSPQTVYRMLAAVHASLLRCIGAAIGEGSR